MAIIVYRTDDWEFPFQYTLDGEGDPLTGVTEIVACLKDEAGVSPVEAKLTEGNVTVIDSLAGRILVTFPKTLTPLVKKGKKIILTVTRTIAGKCKTHELEAFLDVRDKNC